MGGDAGLLPASWRRANCLHWPGRPSHKPPSASDRVMEGEQEGRCSELRSVVLHGCYTSRFLMHISLEMRLWHLSGTYVSLGASTRFVERHRMVSFNCETKPPTSKLCVCMQIETRELPPTHTEIVREAVAHLPSDSATMLTLLMSAACTFSIAPSMAPALSARFMNNAAMSTRSPKVNMWWYEEAAACGVDAGYIQMLETRVGTLLAACEGDSCLQ